MTSVRRALLAVLAATAAAGVYGLLPGLVVRAVVYDLAALAVVAVVVLNVRRSPRDRRQWWLATAVGFALLLVGNVGWDVALRSGMDPAGGVADWTFVAGYALTAVGLSGVAATYLHGGWVDVALEAVAAGALLGALVWVWADTAPTHGWGEVVAVLLVVFSTVRTLALVRVAIMHRDDWRLAVAALGLLVWLGADVVYAGASLAVTYKTGGWLDAVWLAAMVLLVVGISGRHVPCSCRAEPLSPRQMVLARRLALALTVGLAPAFVLLATQADRQERAVLAAAAAVVGLAVVVRVELLNTRHGRVRRQRDEVTARYEQLFEGTTSPMLLVDHAAGGRIVDANPAAVELYGHDRSVLRSMSISEINTMPPAELAAALDRAHRRPGTPFEFRHRLASGQVIPVDVYSGPIPFDGREVLFSIVHDASARHEALDAARDTRRRWQQLAELADDMVYRASYRDGRLTSVDYVNPAGRTVLGIAPATLMADPSQVAQHIHPDDRDRFLHLDERTDATSATFRWQRPDGRTVWLEDRRALAEGDHGATTVVGVVRDVTARRHTEQALRSALHQQEQAAGELRRVDRMKTTFLQATSHELRTPLTSLVGFIETLRGHRDALDAREQDLLLARAEANAHRLRRLVENLLELNLLSDGLTTAPRQETDLGAVLEDLVATSDLGDHEVTVHVEHGRTLGDPVLLERALGTLLDNALRHTPPGTPIRVEVTRPVDGAGPRVVVEDEGPGLPEELLERGFRPFQHGPQALTDPNPGLGIGLALTAQIAALHAGTLYAENPPGGGARLTLQLGDTTHEPTSDPPHVRSEPTDHVPS